jgi:para-aminobenzoate synthetase component 1
VAFAPLAARPMAVLLDSARTGAQGRYSIIAADPFRVVRTSPAPWRTTVDGKAVPGKPLEVLARELAACRLEPGPVPFCGGAIGFCGYELGGTIEQLPPAKDTAFPFDMIFGLYDTAAIFDHHDKTAWVVSMEESKLDDLESRLGNAPLPAPPDVSVTWTAGTTKGEHETRVRGALEYIRAGDIIQANITQRWHAPRPAMPLFDLYRRLRERSPAPFAAFLNFGDGLGIMSMSPERFLQADASGAVETRPIKGTRPRGRHDVEDRALALELSASAKDRAENLMIVDLLRNDLGRVCEAGSVRVPVLCALETFPTVHHLVSVVAGRLRKDARSTDLLQAAFPGGSITGAPKIRAMEIIHELEPSARGPYCGTIAWLGFDGAMDSSIVIRTVVSDGRSLTVGAGGGIVADSDPAREYEECLVKARPLLTALGAMP